MRNSLPILLVDDDRVDAMLFKRALENLEISNTFVQLDNCKEALEYLRDENNQKPCIILMDLNTPQMDGFEFLKALKADTVMSQIPVIVLTGSEDQQDVTEAFRLGAAGYMVKASDYKKLVEMVGTIHTYWTLSRLPSQNPASLSV